MAGEVTTTSTLNGGGITITVYEDVGDDGTGSNTDPNGRAYDNSDSATLSGGTGETNSLSNLSGGTGNAYWYLADFSVSSTTSLAPTLTSVSLDTEPGGGGGDGPSQTWETATDWDSAQSELGTHHETPTGSDYAPDDQIEQGPPATMLHNKSPEAVWFCQESGSTINDVTGNGYDMSVNGATPDVSGPLGFTAYDFDGTDDDAKTTQTSTVDGDITMGALVKFVNSSAFAAFVSNDTDSTSDDGTAQIYPRSRSGYTGVQLSVQFDDNADNREYITGATQINDDVWHLVGATWDNSTGEPKLWVDGSEETDINVNQSQNADNAANPYSMAWQLGVTRDDFNWHDGKIAYAFLDLSTAWTASDWSDLWDAFTGTADHTSLKKTF